MVVLFILIKPFNFGMILALTIIRERQVTFWLGKLKLGCL